MTDPSNITDDEFLGGRLRIFQMRKGHRAGHDAVLLAAATYAIPGDRIVELGAGVGVTGLAVTSRTSGINLTLVDNDPAMIDLAGRNAKRNAIAARIVPIDIAATASVFFDADLLPDSFDQVMMNPPFNNASRHQPSPDLQRRGAHEAGSETLEIWIHTARRLLKPGGALTLIWRAEGLADVLAALRRGFGGVVVLPVYPKPAASAIRILVRATKGSRQPLAVIPGIMLGDEAGQPNAETDGVLRGEILLRLAQI